MSYVKKILRRFVGTPLAVSRAMKAHLISLFCLAIALISHVSWAKPPLAAVDNTPPRAVAPTAQRDSRQHPVMPHSHLSPSAQASAAPPGAERARWYGWQTLLADGASGLLVGVAVATETETLLPFAALGYLLGAPVIHEAHPNSGSRSLVSLGMRLGLPVAGVLIAGAVADCQHTEDQVFDLCPVAEMAMGGLAGMGAAIVLDSSVLAFEGAPAPAKTTLRVLPGVAFGPHSGSFVLSGSF